MKRVKKLVLAVKNHIIDNSIINQKNFRYLMVTSRLDSLIKHKKKHIVEILLENNRRHFKAFLRPES